MRFRTEYKAVPSQLRLDPRRPIALLGSCFAENIARKMKECDWSVFNDAGTLYNPLSIARVLDLILFERYWESEIHRSLFRSEETVHSWLFDSHFSRADSSACVEAVRECRERLSLSLESAQAVVVTFGTAWCYFLAESEDYVVANCHKQHPALFDRRRISIGQITEVWTRVCGMFRDRYPDLKVIFTVSPVRHLKDGFEGNSRSKATLLLAVEEICRKNDNALYFPAYEIVCDDLRDYRFYASDLTHPSEQAVEYIWEIFRQTFIDTAGESVLKDGNRRYKARNHRPLLPAGGEK